MTRLTGVPRFEPPALSRVKRAIGPRFDGPEIHDVLIPADTNNEFAQGPPRSRLKGNPDGPISAPSAAGAFGAFIESMDDAGP